MIKMENKNTRVNITDQIKRSNIKLIQFKVQQSISNKSTVNSSKSVSTSAVNIMGCWSSEQGINVLTSQFWWRQSVKDHNSVIIIDTEKTTKIRRYWLDLKFLHTFKHVDSFIPRQRKSHQLSLTSPKPLCPHGNTELQRWVNRGR